MKRLRINVGAKDTINRWHHRGDEVLIRGHFREVALDNASCVGERQTPDGGTSGDFFQFRVKNLGVRFGLRGVLVVIRLCGL